MIAWWQPLLGVVAGWLLSQGTEVIRQRRRARKNKTAISAELRDINSSTKLIINETVEFIKTPQITKGVDIPTHNIVNQVFKTTFSDTLLELTERERLILARVHDAVDRINSMFSTIRLSDVYLGTEDSINEKLRKILIATSAAYIDACKINVLIEMFTGDGDIRDADSIERVNRVAGEAAAQVRSLRGQA